METLGERGIGREKSLSLSISLAGFWLAIYLASNHPGCWNRRRADRMESREIIQLMMMDWEGGQLVIVWSICPIALGTGALSSTGDGFTACS